MLRNAGSIVVVFTILRISYAIEDVNPAATTHSRYAGMTVTVDTTDVGAYRLVPESTLPALLVSSRPGTIQNWIHVTSTFDCQGGFVGQLLETIGINTTCNCVPAPQGTDHAVLVNVDYPCGPGPFPIVWLFHGFPQIALNSNRLGTTSNSFDVYVNKLLAAGFAVIQYDNWPEGTIPFTQPTEVVETQFAKQILDWMKILATENPSSNFYKKLDFNHIALAGHSHGGKLAAYIHAKDYLPNVYTLFLIDPVDNICIWPATSNCYPPAVDALRGKNKTMYIFGSTIHGCLNPTQNPKDCGLAGGCTGTGPAELIQVAGPGSVLEEAAFGHLQMANSVIWGTELIANIFAGYNSSVSNLYVQDVISDRLVTWVKSQLLKIAPSYGPYLEDYEKGCPATLAAEDEAEPVAKTEADAQAPTSGPSSSLPPTTAPSEISHGLVSSSRAIEAEPAPQIPPELS